MPDVRYISSAVKTVNGYLVTRMPVAASEPNTPKPVKSTVKTDFKSQYERLKYSEEQQEANESKMDQFLIDARANMLANKITKREAIDKCLSENRYNQKLIMFTTMSYQSTVYERAKLLTTKK